MKRLLVLISIMIIPSICLATIGPQDIDVEGKRAEPVKLKKVKKKIKYPNISLNMFSQPLNTVLSIITREKGFTYTIKDGADPNRLVDVYIKNLPLDKAIQQIASLCGYFVKVKDKNFTIFRDKEVTLYIDFPVVKQKLEITSSRQSNIEANTGSSSSSSGGESPSSATSTAESTTEINSVDNFVKGLRGMLSPTGKMVFHKESAVLWVRDRADIVDSIEKYVSRINGIITSAVNIKGIITEITLNNEHEFGVNWSAVITGVLHKTYGMTFSVVDTVTKVSDSVLRFSVDSNDKNLERALITAMKKYGNVRVLSRPCISVTNGAIGTITAGEAIYYVAQSYTSASDVSLSTSSTIVQPIQTGLTFYVMPRIISKDEAIIYIAPELTSLVELRTITSGDITIEAPRLTMKQTQTVVRVKNGERIIIGGIMGQSSAHHKSGVPVLQDIPVLGYAFRSESNKKTTTEFALILEVSW